MRRALLVVFVAALAVQSPAQGDVLLNEVHAFGGGAAPPFAGDVLELWNRTATPIDLQGWTVGAWAGDQGALTLKTFPTGTPLVVPPFCFFLLQESPASEAGLPLSDPALTPFVGLRVGPMPWTSGASVGAFVKDASGQNHDYVHLHRGAGAPPASPPHLAAAGVGASWNGGSVATSGAGHAHLRRLGLVDLDHAGDWAQAPTASRGTFGEYNAPSQVGVGCGPANQGLALYGHPNGLGADLVVSGIGGPTWPLQGVLFAGVDAVDLVVTSPTNPGAPFFLLVSPTVNAGHFVDPAGQRLDLGAPSLAFCDVDVFAFSSITPLCSGLVPGVFGALDGSGAYALSLPLNGLVLPDLALQAAVLDFSAPLLLRFTAATRVGFRPGYGDGRRLAIPDGVGTPAPGPSVWREVVVSGRASCSRTSISRSTCATPGSATSR